MCSTTGQYIIFDEDTLKIKHARTIKMMPDSSKWDAKLIENIDVTPFDEFVGADMEVAFRDRPVQDGDEEVPRKAAKNRNLYIKQEDIRVYGLTVGCKKWHLAPVSHCGRGPSRERVRGRLFTNIPEIPVNEIVK